MKLIHLFLFSLCLTTILSCSSLQNKPNPTFNGCNFKFELYESSYEKNNKKYLLASDPKIKIHHPKFEDLSSVSEDWMRAKNNGKYGFINLDGNVVIDYEFSLIGDFHEGYAVFRAGDDRKDPRGFLSKKGELLGEKYYDMTYLFQNGVAGVEINKKYGLIDNTGKILIPIKYDFITGIFNDWAIFKRDEHQGLINRKGQEKKFVHDKYDIRGYYYEGTIAFTYLKKVGIMDSNFKEIIPPIYDYLGNFKEGLIRFKLGKKWGFLDKNGKVVIEPKFDTEYDFNEGFAIVSIGEKYGIINQRGEYLIEPKFTDISSFHDGLAIVEEGGKKGFINTNAEWMLPPILDNLDSIKEGVFIFKLDEKWGYANLRGCLNR